MAIEMTSANREALKKLRETLPFTDQRGTSSLVFQAEYHEDGSSDVSLLRIDGDPSGVFEVAGKLLWESEEIAIVGQRIVCPGATLEIIGYNLACDTFPCVLLEYTMSGKELLAQLRKNTINLDES